MTVEWPARRYHRKEDGSIESMRCLGPHEVPGPDWHDSPEKCQVSLEEPKLPLPEPLKKPIMSPPIESNRVMGGSPPIGYPTPKPIVSPKAAGEVKK